MRSAPVLWLLILAAPVSAQNPGDFLSRYPADPYSCTAAAEGTRYANTATHTMRYCDGSAWADILGSGGGGGGITGSGSANTIPKFTGANTIGNSTVTDDGTVVTVNTTTTVHATALTDGTRGFLNVIGTLPSSPSTTDYGARFLITPNATSNEVQVGVGISLGAGYTGSTDATIALSASTVNAGTGTDYISTANYGVLTNAAGSTAGVNVGIRGTASGGSGNMAIQGVVSAAGESIGGMFLGRSSGSRSVGVIAGLGSAIPDLSALSAGVAALYDNSDKAAPVVVARDNGNDVFEIGDGGNLQLDITITAGGTTGNQTINKAAGTVNFAAAASTLTVTNSLVSSNSLVFAIARTNDTTCMVKDVEAASGSFVIRMTAACTAETSVAFWVINDA